MIITCKHCGIEFEKRSKNNIFCKLECKQAHDWAAKKAKIKETSGYTTQRKYEKKGRPKELKLICRYCGVGVEILINNRWCSPCCENQAAKLIKLNEHRASLGNPPLGADQFQREYIKLKWKREGMYVGNLFKSQGVTK